MVFALSNVLGTRLQREEEAAYASSHGAQTQSHSQSTAPQPHPGHASLGPFSKFEEKKTNEKTRKVTTVKKFFSPSSRTPPKKGLTFRVLQSRLLSVLVAPQSAASTVYRMLLLS